MSEAHDQVELQTYEGDSAVRAAIEDGDVLLFRGTEILQRVIQFGTAAAYSHAALCFRSGPHAPFKTPWEDDRVCLIEAVGTGVRLRLLSDELRDYPGIVELWRVHPDWQPLYRGYLAVQTLRAFEGLPYDYESLPNFVYRFVSAALELEAPLDIEKPHCFFCSQLVSYGLRAAGVDPNPDISDALTSPGDLIRGGRLAPIHAFAKAEIVDGVNGRVSRPSLLELRASAPSGPCPEPRVGSPVKSMAELENGA